MLEIRPWATSGTGQGLCPGFWLVETLRKIWTEAPIKTWTISRLSCLFFLASTLHCLHQHCVVAMGLRRMTPCRICPDRSLSTKTCIQNHFASCCKGLILANSFTSPRPGTQSWCMKIKAARGRGLGCSGCSERSCSPLPISLVLK